ncbi:MAG: cytochrome B [Rhizobiales bacterium]|nr:cytochrome B [Hyphomicrobiales bacterium]
MSRSSPANYSISQRTVHWVMAALILFNLLFTEGIEQWNRVSKRGGELAASDAFSANIHAYVGIAILAFAALRLILRKAQGVPPEYADEPALARMAAKATHILLYLMFFLMPLSGIARYYFGVDTAGELHAEVFKVILWALIAVHVAGAAAQRFYFRTDSLKRMTSGV